MVCKFWLGFSPRSDHLCSDGHLKVLLLLGFFAVFSLCYGLFTEISIPHQKFISVLALTLHFPAKKWLFSLRKKPSAQVQLIFDELVFSPAKPVPACNQQFLLMDHLCPVPLGTSTLCCLNSSGYSLFGERDFWEHHFSFFQPE